MSEKCQGSVRDLPGTDPTPETSPADVSVFRPEGMEHLSESLMSNPGERDSEPTLQRPPGQSFNSERSEGPGEPGRLDLPGDPLGLREDRPWYDERFLLDCYRGRAPNYLDGGRHYRKNPG